MLQEVKYARIGSSCMVLNQNSSADRLGLNPAGLTKWEKHQKSVKSHNLMHVSFSKEMLCQSEAHMKFVVQQGGLLSSIWELKMFLDIYVNRRLSTTTQSTKGKQNYLCTSSKRVVPDKYSKQKDSVVDAPMVVRASRKLVSTYFRVSRTYMYSLRDFRS